MVRTHIGMSGWTFEGWRGDFYPKGLVQKKELEYASRKVNSIEINGTFYALQKPPSFEKWYGETPEKFVFSIKAPQYITHVKRLKEVDEPVANFFASGLFCLKEKLGPILWQFPPNVTLKDDRFEKFMKLLPYDAPQASKLAKKHSEKMYGRNVVKCESDARIRHAFEFRHPSFDNVDFLAMMKSHGVAVVFAHAGAVGAPYIEELTADFVYARMHGHGPRYKKGYPEEVLREWATKLKAWKKEAFIYFDTYEKEFSPYDAMSFARLVQG